MDTAQIETPKRTDSIGRQMRRSRAPKPKHLRDKLVVAAATMHGKGMHKTDIAKALDVSPSFVIRVLNSNELQETKDDSRGMIGSALPTAAVNVCDSIRKGSVSTSLAALRGMGVFQPDVQVQVGMVIAPTEWMQTYEQPQAVDNSNGEQLAPDLQANSTPANPTIEHCPVTDQP